MICKINDICYIKKSLRPTNVGLVVLCKSYLGYYLRGDTIELNNEFWIAHDSDNYWLIENNYSDIETQFGNSREAYIMDTWLEPIDVQKKGNDTTTKNILTNEQSIS